MVHPDDERYAHLIGKSVRLPLADRLIPVIADDYVDREFGTGVVKITPAHDFNDYAGGPAPRPATDQHLHARRTINDSVPQQLPRPRPLRGAQARARGPEAAGLLESMTSSTS